MPELSFHVEGAEAMVLAATPMMAFKLRVANSPPEEQIHSILLRCQVQLEVARRKYSDAEQSRLFDLFGTPETWSRSLHTMLWTQTSLSVPGFSGSTVVDLAVPCTYDLNLAATRYFDALEHGDVPLRFLFSGTAFYRTAQSPLLVAQIPWDKEAAYRMPLAFWQEMMDRHYPNSAWLYLRKDVFDRLHDFKRKSGSATWEQAIQNLLDSVPALTGPQELP